MYNYQDRFENQTKNTNEGNIRAIGRTSQSVNLAIEKLTAIGEIISNAYPEVKADMYLACKNARDRGKSIERLCDISGFDNKNYLLVSPNLSDQNNIVIAAKSLMSSITRILLLVDIVVVKQLLSTKVKVSKSIQNLQAVTNFTDFVKAFAVFGIEMIELAIITERKKNSLKQERRWSQMFSARQVLEQSINILLTSSKTSLIHYDCNKAKENRDTVFCQIRRAMDMIHFVVKDSISDYSMHTRNEQSVYYEHSYNETVNALLKKFMYLIESYYNSRKREYTEMSFDKNILNYNSKSKFNDDCLYENLSWSNNRCDESEIMLMKGCTSEDNLKYTTGLKSKPLSLIGIQTVEHIFNSFDKLLEKIQDFTDSAYTSHENREHILSTCDAFKLELNKYINIVFKNEQFRDDEIEPILKAVQDLNEKLLLSVKDQILEVYQFLDISLDLVNQFHTAGIKQDNELLHQNNIKFHDYCDHIIDVCNLLQHIAPTEILQVRTNCLSINLRIYGPQVLVATKVLLKYPASVPAQENLKAFTEMWKWLILEITTISKQILESSSKLKILCQAQTSQKEETQDSDDITTLKDKNSFGDISGVNESTNDCNNFNAKWNSELNDNDIVKRAKNMSAMAFSMYQFTKGNGTLRTTQDLFTQAEYFAEEANRLYKIMRQFSYQVPAGQNKKDLLNTLDTIPIFVQALQFTVKDHTVGRAATFMKVDHVIKETKNLMAVINNVVTKCFDCANKYKLDFTCLAGGLTSGSLRGDESSCGGIGDSKGPTNNSESSI